MTIFFLGVVLLGTLLLLRQLSSFFLHPSVELFVTLPEETKPGEKIIVIGNHPAIGEWREPGLELTPYAKNLYYAKFRVPSGTQLKFKFARGSWDKVEKDRNFNEVANRTLKVQSNVILNQVVENWSDHRRRFIPSSLTGNFKFHDDFRSEKLKNSRPIIVYLPPSYDKFPDRRYPVLYMHDGNNIFDRATAFAGVEWEVDETSERLIREGKMAEIIIVGVYNTAQRIHEYSHIPYNGHGGGGADDYAFFLTRELKPFIDKTYRSLTDRENTAIMGSSMGGLVSLYLGFRYPEYFSKIGAMSSSLWWGKGDIIRFIQDHPKKESLSIWLDVGTEEGSRQRGTLSTMVRDSRRLKKILERKGYRINEDFYYLEAQGEGHNEAAWGRRVHLPLERFFKPQTEKATGG